MSNLEAGWQEFQEEEISIENYIQRFDVKLTRANITGKVKEILMKSYICDIAKQNGLKVI